MIRLLAGLGVALVALAAAGCGGGGGSGEDPATIVRESAASTEKVKTFHFALDISKVPTTAKGLQLTGAEGDAKVPDEVKVGLTFIFAERVEDVWKEALIPLYVSKGDRKYDEAEYRAEHQKSERPEQR